MHEKTRSAQEVVDRQIAAYRARDIEQFVECYADDAVCEMLANGQEIARGSGEIRRIWGDLFSKGPIKLEILGRQAMGGFVIDHEFVRFADGQSREAFAVYLVNEERIQHVWFAWPEDEVA